jgi:hypothetical protein
MDALAAIEADSRVQVLVTRMNFGEGKLNGLALSRMLLVKRRAVNTVFIARPEYAHLADGIGEFLSRPLNPHHLVDVVARLLSSRGQGTAAAAAVPPADRQRLNA